MKGSMVIPPHGLVLLAIVAIQLGAALSTKLFPALGVEGTVAVRIIFSAVLLTIMARSKAFRFAQTFTLNWAALLAFGTSLAGMYFCFYQALARIPLGATVALEFIGPLSIAVISSRRLSHFFWVGLAATGIFLLSPMSGADLDPIGVLFALLAGSCWAAFIVLAGHIGRKAPDNDGLAIGMIIAGVLMIPYALPVASKLVADPMVLILGLGVALLSTTIPFTFEFEALKRLSARTYGVLVSIEPAVATLVGGILLGEQIGTQGLVAVACVVVAAIGITITDGRIPPEASDSGL